MKKFKHVEVNRTTERVLNWKGEYGFGFIRNIKKKIFASKTTSDFIYQYFLSSLSIHLFRSSRLLSSTPIPTPETILIRFVVLYVFTRYTY